MLDYDWIVVGAGMTGSTFAAVRAEQYGDRVLVVEQRHHVGGNCYDEYAPGFGLIHVYGPHLFHTNSAKVANFLGNYTDWRPYEHRVLAAVDGQQVPLPINFRSIEMLFPRKVASELIEDLLCIENYGASVTLADLTVKRPNSPLLKLILSKVFKPYSEKQWGTTFDDIDPAVLKRVPIRLSYDDRYFTDTFQWLPGQGYTKMFQNMLRHPNINVMTNTKWDQIKRHWSPSRSRLYWTGTIDSYHEYEYGPLPYRTIDFQNIEGMPLQTGTLNLPMDQDYTRVSDQSIINNHPPSAAHILTYEEPAAYNHLNVLDVPYYPVTNAASKELYRKYSDKAAAFVTFGGRLGSFQYLNMDQACAQALSHAGYIEDPT